MKLAFAARGLPICDYEVVLKHEWRKNERRRRSTRVGRLGFPLFVKPANLGSSVGISKARHAVELRAAITLAAEFDRKIIVEAAVPNAREIECSVLGNDEPEASVPGEIVPSREFYDYEAKYIDDGSVPLIPAPISEAQTAEVRALADRGVQGHRRRRHGAGRFPPRPRQRRPLRERGQHDSRLHDDRHVREDVGGERSRLSARSSIGSSRSRSSAIARSSSSARRMRVHANARDTI